MRELGLERELGWRRGKWAGGGTEGKKRPATGERPAAQEERVKKRKREKRKEKENNIFGIQILNLTQR